MSLIEASITLKGDLQRNLEAYKRKLKPKIERGLKMMALVLLEEAKSFAQFVYDTGALHDSGSVNRYGSGFDAVYAVGFGRKDFDASGYPKGRDRRPPMFYAVTVHQTYFPFLETAVVTCETKMIAAFNKEMQ